MSKNDIRVCSICGVGYIGFGNNAWPINPGRCCDACNDLVITHRIRNVQRGGYAYQAPEWLREFGEKILDDPALKSQKTDNQPEGKAKA